jgi:hypothetical protein
MPEEKNAILSYKITRFEDGSISVVEDGTETGLGLEDLYKDIEEVADEIKRNKIERAAYIGATEAVNRFYAALIEMRNREAATDDNANI